MADVLKFTHNPDKQARQDLLTALQTYDETIQEIGE